MSKELVRGKIHDGERFGMLVLWSIVCVCGCGCVRSSNGSSCVVGIWEDFIVVAVDMCHILLDNTVCEDEYRSEHLLSNMVCDTCCNNLNELKYCEPLTIQIIDCVKQSCNILRRCKNTSIYCYTSLHLQILFQH